MRGIANKADSLTVGSVAIRFGGARRPSLNTLTTICLLAVCLMSSVLGALAITKSVRGGDRDFVEFWAAGQLLTHGGNPYESSALLRLERLAGAGFNEPLIAMNPPVFFFLVAPLGFVGAKTAAILWTSLFIVSLVVSIHLSWILCGRPGGRLHWLGFCSGPVLTGLMAGQIGILLLLGTVLFLYLHKSRPFLAGSALLLCCLKPHLFLPIGIVLLLWTVSRKQYRILAGIATALLVTSAFAFFIDPQAWSQYAHFMIVARPSELFVPTLSKMFRLLIHRDSAWLQFLPAVAGCCWAAWYFWNRRARWNWMEQGMLLLIVSVACAPYAWFTDEAVLLPALFTALYRRDDSGWALLSFSFLAGVPLAELLGGLWITTPFYIWTVPAWLAWYLYASHGDVQTPARVPS